MIIQFFAAMIPPTVTYQEKKLNVKNGKPVFYEPPRLKEARAKLMSAFAGYAPDTPYSGAVRLAVKWCFPKGKRRQGKYKTTKPDTDNLQKLLKDVMTDLNFWKDDALVVSEIVEKFWADPPGIFIRIEELEE